MASRSAREIAYETIRSRIITMELKPGDPLNDRELAEELGIGVRECRFWQSLEHSYAERGFRVRLHFFHVTAFSGEPCPAEGQNLRWVTPAEAPELGFLPADAGVLEQLRAEGAPMA